MLKNLFKAKKDEGFTIIEVLIVLAIAGIILVVVLIAVPQLQRNQRNEARRNVAARISTEINNFASNNGGRLPAAVLTTGASNFGVPGLAGDDNFFNRYLGCVAGTPPTCTSNIEDPRSGDLVGTGTATTVVGDDSGAGTSTLGAEPGSIAYDIEHECNGEAAATNGNDRQFSFRMRLEGGAIACIDNK